MRAEPCTLEEQLGCSLGASALVVDRLHAESPLLRIAALGRAGHLLAAASSSDRATLGALLASRLWRMRYGAEYTEQTARESVVAFCRWLALGVPWQREPHVTRAELLAPFAGRVLYEWIDDRCPYCGGTGQQELVRGGQVRRPRRFGDPRVRFVPCRSCGGDGVALPQPVERADTLGIGVSEYREHWPARFTAALTQLSAIAHRMRRPLRSELERRTVAPQ